MVRPLDDNITLIFSIASHSWPFMENSAITLHLFPSITAPTFQARSSRSNVQQQPFLPPSPHLYHLIMDLPQPRELLDKLDYELQAMRVLLHQIWTHPLILLFLIYLVLGEIYLFRRLDMRLRTTESTDYLDACWLQLFGGPVVFIFISHYICGVEFDVMHINDLIEISWAAVMRRAKRGLNLLCTCRKNDL